MFFAGSSKEFFGKIIDLLLHLSLSLLAFPKAVIEQGDRIIEL